MEEPARVPFFLGCVGESTKAIFWVKFGDYRNSAYHLSV